MFISLLIEEGRYKNIAKPNRLYTKCGMNVVENEYHFIFVWKMYCYTVFFCSNYLLLQMHSCLFAEVASFC